jgi:hypothetical protein
MKIEEAERMASVMMVADDSYYIQRLVEAANEEFPQFRWFVEPQSDYSIGVEWREKDDPQ